MQLTLLAIAKNCDRDPLDEDSCWLWLGSKTSNGYPQIRTKDDQGRPYSISCRRLVWKLYNGREIPPGQFATVRCNDPECINPDHLRLESRAQYMRKLRNKRRPADVVARASLGRRKARDVKINLEQARQIRSRAAAGELQRVIAAELNVSRSLVSMVVTGKLWREATPFTGLSR